MAEHARFTLQLTLRDNHRYEEPLHMAIDLNDEVRISPRAVDELKAGPELGVSLMTMESAVRIIKQREFRKDLFIEACRRLGGLLAERMEDAEGWHDQSRIEPARKELGGRW